MRYLIFLIILFFTTSREVEAQSNISKSKKVSYEIFQNSDSTFGYKILIDTKPYILQNTIPGVAGNRGFKNRKDAIAVSKLIINKINMGEKLPSISLNDLRRLKIIK